MEREQRRPQRYNRPDNRSHNRPGGQPRDRRTAGGGYAGGFAEYAGEDDGLKYDGLQYDGLQDDGLIEGRNAVTEALRAGTPIDRIYLQKGAADAALGHIASAGRAAGAVVADVDRRKLDRMSRTHAHQGVIAVAAVREYATVEQILSRARERGEPPLLVVCDGLTDPRNLGAVIRAAECAGAHGVIVPKRRSAGLNAVVGKTSAGAVSYLPVARVPNLAAALKDLKKQGIWIYGSAAGSGASLYEADLRGPAALVIGSEGEGMSRLTAETCDFLLHIPMKGRIQSLNASAAAAVLLYEAVRQRGLSAGT